MKCCDMTAGQLRTGIRFERKTTTLTDAGGTTDTWTTIAGAPVRAMVKAVGGSERYASDRVEAHVRLRAVVPYFLGLKEADRVVIDGRAHQITFIDNMEFRNKWLRIDLQGGVPT